MIILDARIGYARENMCPGTCCDGFEQQFLSLISEFNSVDRQKYGKTELSKSTLSRERLVYFFATIVVYSTS